MTVKHNIGSGIEWEPSINLDTPLLSKFLEYRAKQVNLWFKWKYSESLSLNSPNLTLSPGSARLTYSCRSAPVYGHVTSPPRLAI